MSAKEPRADDELELGWAGVRLMLERSGQAWSESDRELLLTYAHDLGSPDDPRQDRFEVLFEAASRGFFHCAAEGQAFVPVERFVDDLGGSLEANYPGAGASFLRLATSYWTLKMLEGRVGLRFSGTALQQILAAVEHRVGKLFFVMPEDDELPPEERASRQRRALRDSGAGIDVEQFLFDNPLLLGNPLA